jgi:phosphate butyryltransferase
MIESVVSNPHLKGLFERTANLGKSTVAVACAGDAHVIEAVVAAKNMASFVLVGDAAQINLAAQTVKADISGMEIINEPDNVKACQKAVSLVASGAALALMKGLVDTSVVMKAVLDKDAGMRTGKTLSHLALFALPTYHKLLFVTDAAINIAPDLETKKIIIQNAVEAVVNLGVLCPKVALLAAKEKADPKMPATMEAAELTRLHQNGELSGCIIDGPLALDNAVSAESATIKGINSPVAGDADILVCPDIEAGNILYKSLAFLAGAANGGVVLGAKKPVILTSRADSAESKLISIALGILSGGAA